MSAENANNLGVVFPSPDYVVDAFLDLADVKRSDTVYDLGCNDGRFLIAAAEERQARCVGVEKDVTAYQKAVCAVQQAGLSSLVDIKLGDAMEVDFHDATVVYLYLSPSGLDLISKKLQEELSPKARVVSYMFRIPGWDSHLVEVKGTSSKMPQRMDVSNVSKLYRYTVPDQKATTQKKIALGTVVAVSMGRIATKCKTGVCCGSKPPRLPAA